MKHARADYNRIQDPAGKIPADEPVFLLRGQDAVAADTVRFYANELRLRGGSPEIIEAAEGQALAMEAWQRDQRSKMPDMP